MFPSHLPLRLYGNSDMIITAAQDKYVCVDSGDLPATPPSMFIQSAVLRDGEQHALIFLYLKYLDLSTCVYIYIYVCMPLCFCIYIYICIHTYVNLYIHISMNLYLYTYISI